MRNFFFIFFLSSSTLGFAQTTTGTYELIHLVTKQPPGVNRKVKIAEVNKTDVNRLNSESLKALAAFYSALAGSNCDGKNCELTSSLGLGVQGSLEQREIIKKWFSNDTVAQMLIKQNCFQSPNGSSSFTNYNSLVFRVNKDTVTIKYTILVYNYGKSHLREGVEKALVKNNEILIIKR